MANEVRINITSRDRSGPGMTSARRNADELGNSTKRVGEIASGILAAGVFERLASSAVQAFKDTIAAASNLEQAVGGTEAVFGDASGAIDAFAKTAAETTGLSEREFREMTTLIGGQLKRMTGDIGFASDASIQLTQVAADLAATYGGTTKEAMDAFAAALRGEADPAERFNLNLKASVVNAKAVEMGLAASTSEVSEQAKAQALLALITEQSADAQGQFAREGDTAAVAGQKLNATIENTQASLGQAFLPAVGAAAGVLTILLTGFQQLPGPVQAVIGGIVALGAAAAAAVVGLRAMGVTLAMVQAALGPIGIALAVGGALIAGLAALGAGADKSGEQLAGLKSILQQVADAADGSKRATAAAALQQDEIAGTAETAGVSLKDLTDVIVGEEGAAERLRDRLEKVVEQGTHLQTSGNLTREVLNDEAKAAQDLIEWLDGTETASKELKDEQGELKEATGETEGSMEDLESQLEETTSEVDKQRSEIEKLISTMFEAAEGALSLSDAEIAYEDQLDKTTEAIAENGQGLDVNTEKGRKNQSALNDLARDGLKLVEALVEEGASARETGRKMEDLRRDFIRNARQAGLTAKEARDLADDYGLIPDEVKTRVDEVGNARERIKRLEERIDDLEREINIRVNETFRRTEIITTEHRTFVRPAKRLPEFAAGGITGAQGGGPRGSDVLVGEQRPEVVQLPFGSRVIPSISQATDRNQTSGALGGGETVMRVVLEVEGAEDAFVEAFKKAFRVRGETLGAAS